MKKTLTLLLTLALALFMLIACGGDGGDTTPPCEHKDKNDDGKCDVCEAAFEDGCDATHKDADDDGKCDAGGEAFDDGKEDAPGTIFSKKSFPAVVYKDSDVPFVIDAARSVVDYMKAHASTTPAVMLDSGVKFQHELVFGDTGRDITAEAKAILETKLAAKKSEEDAPEDLAAYMIYSNGSSVAVVWSDFQVAEVAVDYFCENYITGDTLVLEEGYTKTGYVTLTEYLEEREDRMMLEAWAALEAAIDEEYREEIMTSLNLLYSLYDFDAATVWLANLYDQETGGWYGAPSGKRTEGYGPDIESTLYMLRNIFGWMGEMYNGDWTKATPNDILMKAATWVQSLQDPDGYFYHPQWPKELIEQTGFQLRITRDLGSATTILNGAGLTPKYSIASTSAIPSEKNLDSRLGASTVAAVSKVVGVSELLDYYDSNEAFEAYLDGFRAELENPKLTDNDIAYNFYLWASYFQTTTGMMTPEMKVMVVEFFDSYQNPENGMWSKDLHYHSTNGIHKIASVYNKIGAELKYAEKIVDSTLEILMWDAVTKPIPNTCDLYNVWSVFPYVYENIRTAGTGTPAEKEARCEAIKNLVYAGAADAIEVTYEQIKDYKKESGSFSTYKNGSKESSNGIQSAVPNTREGDLSGFLFATYDMAHHIFDALELVEYEPPYFTEEDRYLFVNLLRNMAPTEKGAPALTEAPVYKFDDGKLPEDVKVSVDNGRDTISGAYIEVRDDGEGNNVLEFNTKSRTSSNQRNYSALFSASNIGKKSNATRFEAKIKVNSAPEGYVTTMYWRAGYMGNPILEIQITSGQGNVYIYDGKTRITLGKMGEYIDFAIEHRPEEQKWIVYANGVEVGTSTATYNSSAHKLVGSVTIGGHSTAVSNFYLDDVCFKTFDLVKE